MADSSKPGPKPPLVRQSAGTPPARSQHKMTKQQANMTRMAVEHLYVFSDEAHSAASIVQRPEFVGLTVQLIHLWIREGDWNGKRRAYLSRLRKVVEDHMAEAIVRQRQEQLRLYDAIHAQFAAFVLPSADGKLAAQPKSAESAVAALLKIDEMRSRLRREVVEGIGSRVEEGQRGAAPVSDITPEQAQRMAHVLMAAELAGNAKVDEA